MTRAAVRLLAAAVAVGIALRAVAARPPSDDLEAPRPLTIRVTDPYLMLETEGDESVTRLPGEPKAKDVTADWTPSIGLGLEGSIYHPRLVHFDADIELGLTEGSRRRDDGAGAARSYDRSFTAERYNASLVFLRAKPYSLTVFTRRDIEQRDYDEFNRFDVDHEQYGARLRHSGERFSWDLRLANTRDDVTNTDRPTREDETLLTFDARYRRSGDNRTTLRYSDRDFSRAEAGYPGYSGVQQNLYVLDETAFGPADRARLLSTLTLADLNESRIDTRSLTLREDFRRRAATNLWHGAIYQFDWRDAGEATSEQHQGELYVEHQLYASLQSRADVQVEQGQTHEDGFRDEQLRYGPGVAEHYNKRLGEVGRLGLDAELRLDRIERDAAGGAIRILDERVQLSDGRPAMLSQPRVQPGSVVVTDSGGTRLYLEGLDYRVVPRGEFTEIQRVFGGAIPNGAVVLVDYTSRGSASDSLSRTQERLAFEIDLYDRLLFLYGARRAVLYHGGDSLVFQDYREHTIGLKSRWQFIEVGVEQVDYEGDALSYEGPNAYAELSWDLVTTALRLRAAKSDLSYRNQPGWLDTRTYTADVDWHPVDRLSLQLFAGDYQESTQDGDRELVSLEARLSYLFHKLTIEGTWRVEEEDLRDEGHDRRYYLLRVKRALF